MSLRLARQAPNDRKSKKRKYETSNPCRRRRKETEPVAAKADPDHPCSCRGHEAVCSHRPIKPNQGKSRYERICDLCVLCVKILFHQRQRADFFPQFRSQIVTGSHKKSHVGCAADFFPPKNITNLNKCQQTSTFQGAFVDSRDLCVSCNSIKPNQGKSRSGEEIKDSCQFVSISGCPTETAPFLHQKLRIRFPPTGGIKANQANSRFAQLFESQTTSI